MKPKKRKKSESPNQPVPPSATGTISGAQLRAEVGAERGHAAIRRVTSAHANLNSWEKAYRADPSDSNAQGYIRAWKEMRAAVDEIIKQDTTPEGWATSVWTYKRTGGDWVALAETANQK